MCVWVCAVNSQPINHEVDEEGYSIRPDDAANVSRFSDDPWGKKDDFSDSSDSETGERREGRRGGDVLEISHSSTIDKLIYTVLSHSTFKCGKFCLSVVFLSCILLYAV